MRKDTAQRIEEYHGRLPRLKEKLTAALILMLVGITMLSTVSFAWLSLSTSPEVSNITSSIASNGNLEVALASGTLRTPVVPGPTQIGDGVLPILGGNLTWGNLINLSDPAYGLDNLVLRPAGLNKDNLLKSPLYGADFIASGKHEGYIGSFRYAKWQSTNPADPEAPWEFVISDELGVRAISSTKMAESGGYAYGFQIKLNEAEAALREAQNAYIAVTNNLDPQNNNRETQYLECLAYVMGAYMTANMNASQSDNEHLINATMDKATMETFRDLFDVFRYVLELELEAYRLLANLQLYVIYKGETGKYEEFATTAALVAKKDNLTFAVTDETTGKTTSVKLQLTGLKESLTDADKVAQNHAKMVALCERGGDIKWGDDGLSAIVNALVNVGNCTVNGTRVSSIGASAALELNGKECATVITNGVLYNFEKRTGANMKVSRLTVKATGKRTLPIIGTQEMTGTIYANITTNAPSPSQFKTDLDHTEDMNTGGSVRLTANDTYGFAIDFWVRTNATGSFLTLEGNVLTERIEEEVHGFDSEGVEVQLYTVTATMTDSATGEEGEYTLDVYEKNGKWYLAETHEEYTADPANPPKKKVNVIENVIGYEGENRVWEDNAFLSIDSNTQGSGSCYVYYYNTPEDRERSLTLLSAMNVAFVDDKGNLLAEGYMDTAHHFDDNGKVIVPLRLAAGSITITNPDGSETLAIAPLEKNRAKLITAIVYLDGTKVGNEEVLSASEVQGQMNIQFGSSVDLNAVPDEKLASQYVSVSASVSNASFNYDEAKENGTPMTTALTVDVEGIVPGKVTAFFVRQISETQALPMNGAGQVMTFRNSGGGTWTADYTFNTPGTYILRSLWIDGVEYDLAPEERPTVEVEGFTVRTLRWASGAATRSFMTAASSVSDDVMLSFVTDEVESMPRTVEGRFVREDGNTVNVPFTRGTGNTWTGKASFLSSGEYTLQYLYFDGEYYPVDPAMQITADIYLGMKTAVYTDSPVSFLFGYGIDGDPSNGMADNEENLYMKIKIMDDTGEELTALRDVKLYYALGGYASSVNGLDADMEWNAATGYYEGEFHTKAGIFGFLYVTVGDNVIKTATTAPRFVIQSPTPPSFDAGNTTEWQYKPNYNEDPAKISVLLTDTDGIEDSAMIGIITDGTTEYRVAGKNMGDGKWQFTVPLKDNSQDGTWTLTRIEIVGIFYNGNITTEEAPYVLDLAGKDALTTTVLSTVNITMSNRESFTLNGELLQTHTLTNALLGGVTITDKYGNALPGMADTIELLYAYGKDSVAKGGYSVNYSVPDLTVTMKRDAAGKYFTQDEAALATVKIAGTYTLSSLSFSFDGGVVALSGASLPTAATITVTSATPTAKITAATAYGSSSRSETAATVYFDVTNGSCGIKNYSQPSVTITLAGMGKATGATMTFAKTGGGDVLLYTSKGGTSAVSTYTWAANGTCLRWVGYFKSNSAATDTKTPAGELKATELVLTDASGSYTVDITDITINNPS